MLYPFSFHNSPLVIVDVRVPFQFPAERVEDADETGSEKLRFVVFVEHAQDNALDGWKKAV